MLHIAVCSDDETFRKKLACQIEHCLKTWFNKAFCLHTFSDLTRLEMHFAQKQTDILFLDVTVRGENAVAWSIVRMSGKNTPIIFITPHAESVYSMVGTNCCCCLEKSEIDEVNLTRALQSALQSTEKKHPNQTVIKHGGINRVINYADIQYIETYNNTLALHLTGNETISVYSSLKDFADRLPSGFLRCHKSFMVNMRHIVGYAPHSFFLRTGKPIPIPPKKYKYIINCYREYLDHQA